MRLVVLTALLLAGCAPPLPTPEALAEFRSQARDVHGALTMPSCDGRSALDRRALLGEESRRMVALEARMPGPLRIHLDIARADVAYAHRVDQSCSDDSDPTFARRHVEQAKGTIEAGLENMERLAPTLVAPPDQPKSDPPDGAAFRRAARRLVELSRPRCEMSTRAENEEIMAPALAELGRFRQRLEGSRHAAFYDIAEADVAYEHTIWMVDCQDPGSKPAAELEPALLAEMRTEISALEARLTKAGGK